MRRHFISFAGGAALCCGTFGYCALSGANPAATAAWGALLLCHCLAGAFAVGGLEAWREGSPIGVSASVALGAAWTLAQAFVAVVAIRTLDLALPSQLAGWMLGSAVVAMVFVATYHRSSPCKQRPKS